LLKRSSKEIESAMLTLELEETTMGCLDIELKNTFSLDLGEVDQSLLKFQEEDKASLMEQIEEQRVRVTAAEKKLRKHAFTSIIDIANELMNEDNDDGRELSNALKNTRVAEDRLQADDLAKFAKSAVVVKRKLRKLAKGNPDVDPEMLLLQAEKVKEIELEDSSWDDMLAISKALIAYGCLVPERKIEVDDEFDDLEDQTFEVTPAGRDVGMLSFEKSLWGFSAMGGTWDVIGASSKLDEMKSAMKVFEEDMSLFDDESEEDEVESNIQPYMPRKEAEDLVSYLRYLSPAEMAGYVSCLVTGDTGRSSLSSIDVFSRLSPSQQRSIQVLLDCTERLMDVQRQYLVDERTCNCQFDVTNCEVVTAWANGCTWNEALVMSGAAPGDLTRVIGRAMDAVRQLGSLKFNPLRKSDVDDDVVVDPFARGIHPDIRRLCREAGKAMNRYPVKDTLPFEAEEEDMFDEDEDADDEIDEEVDDEIDDDVEFADVESEEMDGSSDSVGVEN
jgi:hypothetical protein